MGESQDTRCGIRLKGIFKFLDFTLGENHEFTVICRLLHDPDYDARNAGFPTRPGSEVDKATFTAWWGVAKNKQDKWRRLALKTEALIFYPIIRVYSLFGRKGNERN